MTDSTHSHSTLSLNSTMPATIVSGGELGNIDNIAHNFEFECCFPQFFCPISPYCPTCYHKRSLYLLVPVLVPSPNFCLVNAGGPGKQWPMATEAVSEGACDFPPITLWLPRALGAGAGLGHFGLEQGFRSWK